MSTSSDARNSLNSRERNSPALSVCSAPTTRDGAVGCRAPSAFMEAMKRRMNAGAFAFERIE